MIDTKELRRLTQAALAGPDGISLNWLKHLQDFQQKASPAAVIELLNRLAAAEKERNVLRAKIKQMERQEPVWFIDERGEPKRYHKSKADYCKYGGLDLLYALPGAQTQGEEK